MAIDKFISGIKVDNGADDNKIPVYNASTGVFDMENPQITVSATEPVDPEVNDLWYDFS